MIRTVLVALDESPRASSVLAAALEIADQFDADVHLLRIIQVPPVFPAAADHGAPADHLEQHMRQQAIAAVRALAKNHPRALQNQPRVRIGNPWRLILEEANALSADLVVVGSHGYHGIDHLLGTTAGQVANRATHNVLVVHRTEER